MTQARTIDEASAWQAMVGRDRSRDGTFVCAVRTTGIFCRPSCPARRPHRENVEFFASGRLAQEAGYRPCKRCHPLDEALPSTVAVRRAQGYLDAHIDETVTLAQLGEHAGMSAHHLQRIFKRELGISPKQYIQARRIDLFKSGLKNGSNVTTATYDAGYGSSSRLYDQSNERLGMTPATYRDGGRGMRIRYTVLPSSIGRVLVGATDRGVCSVMIGDSDEALSDELLREYPNAEIERGRRDEWADAVARYASGALEALDVPLDVRATAFQWRVWEALRAIPRGSTMTYREIAVALNKPKAARAVGRACATNRVSLIVPCHRAVREGGGLGGYRWGLERKQRLLEQERRAPSSRRR